MNELFNQILRAVAHPHKLITSHDVARAKTIFLSIGDYLEDPSYHEFIESYANENLIE